MGLAPGSGWLSRQCGMLVCSPWLTDSPCPVYGHFRGQKPAEGEGAGLGHLPKPSHLLQGHVHG